MISLLIPACSTTKEAGVTRAEKRELRKIAEREAVKKAVESRRYIIKMDRINVMGGGFLDLIPRNNFIIINGESASISLGYIGRQFGIRPISGINFNGQTVKYELDSREGKSVYNINMEVKYRNDKFDLYLTVGYNGNCSVSIINSYIQSVSYSGKLVPIAESDTGNTVRKDQL